jgi:redox-sensing transcriptional repressor
VKKISESAVRRLSTYLRLLREVAGQQDLISSQELAERVGATSAQVRKDLSLFGSFGQRGRGYEVSELIDTLERILGLARRWRVAIVGVGKLGSALLGYRELSERGFDVVAAFDVDSRKVGAELGGLAVSSIDSLASVVREREVEIGIIATPPDVAPEVAERLAKAGVSAILNFAPVKIGAGDSLVVRTMDLALELEGLTFALTSALDGESSATDLAQRPA